MRAFHTLPHSCRLSSPAFPLFLLPSAPTTPPARCRQDNAALSKLTGDDMRFLFSH